MRSSNAGTKRLRLARMPTQGPRDRLRSNIHFGYVGVDVGFSSDVLTKGAGLADLMGQDRTDPGDGLRVGSTPPGIRLIPLVKSWLKDVSGGAE